MGYRVEYDPKAKRRIRRVDAQDRKRIKAWIDQHLVDCENPRMYGKALVGSLAGLWRYRVGRYRVLAKIQDDEILILIVDIGHRQGVYKKQ